MCSISIKTYSKSNIYEKLSNDASDSYEGERAMRSIVAEIVRGKNILPHTEGWPRGIDSQATRLGHLN